MSGDLEVVAAMDEWPGMTELHARIWREYTRGGHDQEIASALDVPASRVRSHLTDLYRILPCPNNRISVAMYGIRTDTFELSPYRSGMMTRPLSDRELNYVQCVADGLTNRAIGAEYHRNQGSIAGTLSIVSRVVGTKRRVLVATRCYRAGLIA